MFRLCAILALASLSASLAIAQNPGNPVTVRADGLGSPIGLIADPFGDFIVSDTAGKQVWWVTTDGRKQVIARDQITVNHGLPWVSPSGIGWDVFANLIIITQRQTNKMTPKSTFSVMFSMDDVKGVALAPDGSLWFAGSDHPAVRHYDPFGTYIETMSWTAANNESTPYLIASSQAGDVYFVTSGPTAPTNVYKVTGKQGQLLFQTSFHAAGLAIDADGNLYFTGDQEGNVYKYSPSGAALENPFASGLDHPTGIAFGRNSDGSMNSRLFVVEGSGRLVELNSGDVSQRGAPIGFATATQATADLLKPGALTDAQRRVLDNVGNKNGRYDVGDLRAFLIQTTALSLGAPFGAGGKP